MASQLALMFQDQNFNVRYSGASAGEKRDGLKSQKKKGGGGGLGGRKPLGEISNSANIAPAQASKRQNTKNFASIKYVVPYEESNGKTSVSKTSDKVGQTRSRKALSDISNSREAPHLPEASKKKLHNMKLSVVEEEKHFFPNSIAEEQCQHDHRKCIKAQTESMEMDHFLTTVGLANVSFKQIESPWVPKSSKMKPEYPLHHLELEEMPEQIEDEYLWKQKINSPPCKTPKSPNYSPLWKDSAHINFKLMETPKLSKFSP